MFKLIVALAAACSIEFCLASELEQIKFDNNGARVTLIPHAKQKNSLSKAQYFYYDVSGSSKRHFAVLNQLIITGTAQIQKIDWQQYIESAEVQTLVELKQLTVLKVSLNNWQLQKAINTVQRLPGVKNVQPELTSLKFYSADSPTRLINAKHKLIRSEPASRASEPLSSTKRTANESQYNRNKSQQDSMRQRVRLALIDDGFNLSHPLLAESKTVFQYDLQSGELDASPLSELERHGTMGLELLQTAKPSQNGSALASDTEIVALRLVKPQTSKLVLAVFLARKMESTIINMSWSLNYLPQALADLLQYDQPDNPQPLTVVAAGNNKADACINNKLALLPSLLIVGSTSSDTANNEMDKKTDFSNYGACVDVYAPQGFVSSIYPDTMFTGTSASAVWISGKISEHFQHNGVAPVKDVLLAPLVYIK